MGQKKKGGLMKRIFIRFIIGGFILLVVLVICGYFFLTSFLSGDSFRQYMAGQIADMAHVNRVTLAPLNWGGSSLGTDKIEAEGDELFRSVEIGKIDAVVDRAALFDQHLRIKELTIDHINVDLYREKEEELPPGVIVPPDRPVVIPERPAEPLMPPKGKSWFERNLTPNRYTFEDARVRSLSLKYTYDGDVYSIKDVRVKLTPEMGNDEYRLVLEDGMITLPYDMVSVGRLQSAYVRCSPNRVSVSEGRIIPNYGGSIDVEGQWEKPNSRWTANLVVRDVHCANLLSPDWKKRVEGVLEGTGRLRGEDGEMAEMIGSARIDKGVLTALPVLDTMAAFTRTNKFRRVSFNAAEANYRYANEVWRISEIVLACDGLMRIEGWIEIGDDESLNGRLQVGIVPGVLSNIPGAEEKVFLPGNNANKMGLLWTNVNLSGTLDSPREDLTARLIAAAGDRLFEVIPETGQKVLLFSGDLASRLFGNMKLPDEPEKKDGENENKDRNRIEPTEIILDTFDRAAGGLFGL